MISTTDLLVSIIIPSYEMKGQGVFFLRRCLDSINKQRSVNPSEIEILISDQSYDRANEKFCKARPSSFSLRYQRTLTGRGIAAHNLNIGINNARGRYVKILFQDDLLVEDNYLATLIKYIAANNPQCILSGATHTKNGIDFYNGITPKENPYFLFGNNTISSPSVLTIEKIVLGNQPFDESLRLLFDCDFYHRLFGGCKKIQICDSIRVANGVWDGQTQFSINEKQFTKEVRYLNWKYPNAHLNALLSSYKAYFANLHPEAPFPFYLDINASWWQRLIWALGAAHHRYQQKSPKKGLF